MGPNELILVDPKPALCREWESHFRGLPHVSIVCGRFEELPRFDCMVSAANSFGLMDGGVDAAITAFFGHSLQVGVQRRIVDEYLGEQPVGTSMIVETGHPKHPFVAHTPTMRVPMPIARTDNVYQAMWAMLVAVRRHNLGDSRKIHVVACPGLGTLTGRVPFDLAARLMAAAYRHSLETPVQLDWEFAGRRQASVLYGGDLGFDLSPEQDPAGT